MQNIKEHCKKCQGKCCIGESGNEIIPITEKESSIIKSNFPNINTFKLKLLKGEIHAFKVSKSGCPFLKTDHCILKENKPLNCKIYPLVFTYDKEIKFWFEDENNCPYINEIQKQKEWISETINKAKKELTYWTEKEKHYFSYLSNLTKLKKI